MVYMSQIPVLVCSVLQSMFNFKKKKSYAEYSINEMLLQHNR